MGFSGESKGIRLLEAFKGPISADDRALALLAISDKPFVKSLLMQKDIDLKVTKEYLNSRMFFPVYIQNAPAIVLFIMSQVTLYKDKLIKKRDGD